MIVLDALSLATMALVLVAGGLGLFARSAGTVDQGRHGRSALARSWSRR